MNTIIAMAQREANKAHALAETGGQAHDAYRQTLAATLDRGHRAEELIGIVESNGLKGQYKVGSQSGRVRHYVVSLGHRKCDCPDRRKGHYCKHLQAAELFEARRPAFDLLAWADELEAVSWYDANLARSLARHGLSTWQQRDKFSQLAGKYPDLVDAIMEAVGR